ncbi:MAG: DUF3040 domain-containing protein [Marmoricola sp.]
MPLSEEELRLLEQMERALAAEDPRFVSALEGRHLVRAARLRMTLAVIGFLGGAAAMGVGMWQRMTWLGIVGFVVMVATATAGLAQWRSHRFVSALGSAEPPPSDDEHYGLRVIQGGRSPRPRPRGNVARTASAASDSRLKRNYAAWLDRLEARWQHRRDQNM